MIIRNLTEKFSHYTQKTRITNKGLTIDKETRVYVQQKKMTKKKTIKSNN